MKLENQQEVPKGIALQQGLIQKNGRIFLVSNSPFKEKALRYIHNSPLVGHADFLKTYHKAKADVYWEGMKKDIKKMVRECDICQGDNTPSMVTSAPTHSSTSMGRYFTGFYWGIATIPRI